MAIDTVKGVTLHRIPDDPLFKDVDWTDSSGSWKNVPDAVKYASGFGPEFVLQSPRSAARFYVEAQRTDNPELAEAKLYQRTRGVCAGMRVGDQYFLVFDDNPDASKNIVLAHAVDGFEAHKAGNEFRLPINYDLVQLMLRRADESESLGWCRRVPAPQEGHVKLSTFAEGGDSAWARDDVVRANVLDQAQPYSAARLASGRKTLRRWALSVDDLENMNLSESEVVIRPVGLGDGGFDDGVGAGGDFGDGSRARGVRGARDFPLETKVQ